MANKSPVAQSYESLFQRYRDTGVVTKARDYCRFTLAKLVSELDPADGLQNDGNNRLPITRDYQSIGALLMNNLVARLGEALFPATRRFVRLKPKGTIQAEDKTKVADALISIEKAIVEQARKNGGYADLLQVLAYLATTGNVALFRDSENGSYLTYGLESFALRRDGRGCVTDAVIKERIEMDSLPEEFQAKLKTEGYTAGKKQRVWLYTRIQRVQRGSEKGYEVTQQIGNYQNCIFTPGKDYYPEKVCPWLFPVWSLKSGEHYGRGMVEDYAGDFARLSMLCESSALYMQEALRVLHLLQGAGGSQDDIEQAESGTVVPLQSGTTLSVYEVGDYQKVQQAREEIGQIMQRLSQAFMYTGEFRDSERTTAAEVQQVARSADRGLGGPYSTQAKYLQIPLAYVLLAELSADIIPDIVGNVLELQVIAGLDALGMSIEAETLLDALTSAAQAAQLVGVINQTGGASQLSLEPVLQTIFQSHGVELEQYKKSDAQIQQEQQQQLALAQAAAGAQAPGAAPGGQQ